MNTRQRYITIFRKPYPDILDWEPYVSQDIRELEEVIKNIRKQGVIQYSTYVINERLEDYSSKF